MSRKYSPKKIDLIYEEVASTPEEIQQILDDAFGFLFEETVKNQNLKVLINENY